MSADLELATYLEAQGQGSTASPAPTITVGQMPESPDTMITLNSLPSRSPTKTMGGTSSVFERIQIRVRMASPVLARAKILAILTLLDGFRGTLGGVRYLFVEPITEVVDVGEDESHRNVYSVVVLAQKDRS